MMLFVQFRLARHGLALTLLLFGLLGCRSGPSAPVIYSSDGQIITALPPGGVGGGNPPTLESPTDVPPTDVVAAPPTETATATATMPPEITPLWTPTPLLPSDAPLQPNFTATPGGSGGNNSPPPDLASQLNLPPQMQVPVSIRPEDHFWFQRPIDSNIVSDPHPYYRYGTTYFGGMSVHAGVDLDARIGTPVRVAGPGVVIWVGYGLYGTNPPENDPYGLAVAIEHSFGYQGQKLYTIYAHLSQIDVYLNQQVQAGDLLGLSGNTGNSTGPHLHFEVRVGENRYRSTRNPELWLAPRVGWGVLAGRLLDERGNYIPLQRMDLRSSTGRFYPLWTYGTTTANADERYQENFVIGDLPAGMYTLTAVVDGERLTGEVEIFAGQTSFLIMQVGNPSDFIWRSASPQATNGPNPNASGRPTRTPTPRPPTGTPTTTPESP